MIIVENQVFDIISYCMTNSKKESMHCGCCIICLRRFLITYLTTKRLFEEKVKYDRSTLNGRVELETCSCAILPILAIS